jgi:hypothetical protein
MQTQIGKGDGAVKVASTRTSTAVWKHGKKHVRAPNRTAHRSTIVGWCKCGLRRNQTALTREREREHTSTEQRTQLYTCFFTGRCAATPSHTRTYQWSVERHFSEQLERRGRKHTSSLLPALRMQRECRLGGKPLTKQKHASTCARQA